MIGIKPIIGIISRMGYSDSKKKINMVYDDIYLAVIKSGGVPLGIPCDIDISNYLDMCNGFILQGGDDINNNNLDIIKILYEKDIPLFGICLGMQEMFYNKDNMVDIDNHKINKLHEVKIIKNTLLYKIIKKDRILVNSRHKSSINKTKYKINAISIDNVIEAIEIPQKRFFLGVQWHPENMYFKDINSRKIFDYFIKICNN